MLMLDEPLKVKACQGTRTWFPPVVLPELLEPLFMAAGVAVAEADEPPLDAAGVWVVFALELPEVLFELLLEELLDEPPATLTTT